MTLTDTNPQNLERRAQRTRFAIVGLGLLLCMSSLAFLLWDTREYREALSRLETRPAVTAIGREAKLLGDDLALTAKCNANHAKASGHDRIDHRACMIEVLSQIKHPAAVVAISHHVHDWLSEHPADQGVVNAAIRAIEAARTHLIETGPTLDRLYGDVNRAREESFVVRAMQPATLDIPATMKMAEALIEAELSIVHPEEVVKWSQFRQKLLGALLAERG